MDKGVTVTEIVTDAHVQIAALMSTFDNIMCASIKLSIYNICIAEKHPRFTAITHSLDVWHKACKLTSKLTAVSHVVLLLFYIMHTQNTINVLTGYTYVHVCIQASKKKQNRVLGCWITAIRTHFWYICRECQGSEEEIRVCACT